MRRGLRRLYRTRTREICGSVGKCSSAHSSIKMTQQVGTTSPVRRGLKHINISGLLVGEVWVGSWSPMRRGLRHLGRGWLRGPRCRIVGTTSPMRRGLKRVSRRIDRPGDRVGSCSPMRRGFERPATRSKPAACPTKPAACPAPSPYFRTLCFSLPVPCAGVALLSSGEGRQCYPRDVGQAISEVCLCAGVPWIADVRAAHGVCLCPAI
jgi:hypothetical protein